jgi:hypothetical protein
MEDLIAVSLGITLLMFALVVFLISRLLGQCKKCSYHRQPVATPSKPTSSKPTSSKPTSSKPTGAAGTTEGMNRISAAYDHLMYEVDDLPMREPVRMKVHRPKNTRRSKK